jgi:hypothetical protein
MPRILVLFVKLGAPFSRRLAARVPSLKLHIPFIRTPQYKPPYCDKEQENALLRTCLAYSKYVTGEQKGVAAVIRQNIYNFVKTHYLDEEREKACQHRQERTRCT